MASRQNPISFKTVPNRNKTQKWQQAKTYNYDGDDWGGYDPYDEYAYDDPPPMPQPPPPQQYGQSQGYGRPPPRKNSFDQGDERRNFSAGPVMYGADSRTSGSPAQSNVSGGDYNDGRPRSRPRDFTNPEQVPPPLAMRGSPGPANFPPRKSSVSGGSPAPEAVPMPTSKKEEKELPIPPMIRPSDIYKRMEVEREKERQSMEGSRPSMESLQREMDGGGQQQGRPLSSVQEDFGEPASKSGTAGAPTLPSMRNVSGIGTSFLHSSEAEQMPATRAPGAKDPAAEILSERMETRAPSGSDSAADILAERSATRAQPGADPAADIMAERGHERTIEEPESGVEHHFGDLKHQPSSGYRSMVDQAFDNDSAPESSLSRDSSVYSQSVGGAGVSRNNSASTTGISPIMSRVPSAATAKMQQQERDRQVPTIAEEPSQRISSGEQQIPRKPSPSGTPSHSRNVSTGSGELVQPGYRRSLDPPSSDNSPARTPGLENTHSRRLSQPMTAETGNAEPPAVADQGVEMMPTLEPGETPAGETPTVAPVPVKGRSRAGTDYSMRESDIAREASTSPEKNEFSPSIAEAASAEQTAFLADHAGTPTSQWPPAIAPASGRSSPNKGRVREIAGKYQTIDAESRRGSTTSSKSSWSNFRGSEENLPGALKKRGTGESGLGSELPQNASETRPGVASQMSFRPQLPGQWVSYAGTPGETPAPVAEQASAKDANIQSPQEEETPDFSPNTDKQQLLGHSPSSSQQTGLLSQAKGAGEALGASLMSTVGIGHQTRDFASKEPPAPVEQPSDHKPTGAMGYLDAPNRPELPRGDTEASMATDIASSASSVPPTPPAKDGVVAGAQHGAAPRQQQLQDQNRPISNYFSGAIAPLQPQKGQSGASANLDLPKLGPMTNMSTDTGEGDTESDRLRKEIVRSLSPTTSREDDAALTQDALDAPDNMSRAEAGQPAEPAAETGERPGLGLLNQRFSWEDRADNKGVLDSSPAAQRTRNMPTVREPEPDPEIRPEMPYERPRSRGLHIVNPEDEDSSDDDRARQQIPQRLVSPDEKRIVSPFTPSQENLRDELDSRDISRDATAADAPSPVPMGGGLEVVDSKDSDGGSGARVPSYYTHGQPDNLTLPKSPSLAQQSPVPEADSPTTPQTAIPDRSPTSPTTKTQPPTSTTNTGKIPPFREILANKDVAKRMSLYTSTRQTFADTNTGLGSWLEGMLEQNPEYAHIGTHLQPSATSTGALKSGGIGGHKHSPSLAKFKQLGSSFASGGDGSGVGSSGIRRTSTQRDASGGSAGAPAVPPKDAVWEQRGKDLMKGAGVLGGKAQAGAKGLLMKGRSRFGTKRESGGSGGRGGGADEKALPAPTAPVPRTTSTPPLAPTRTPTTNSRYTDSLVVPNDTSSSSAAHSRSPSQAPSAASASASASVSGAAKSRNPSQAPSRTGSSLSRTWSRLRERRSQGQSSRSRSRPGSLVLSQIDPAGGGVGGSNMGNEAGAAGMGLAVVDDASPVAVRSFPPGATELVHTSGPPAVAAGGEREEADVISPWSEPDSFLPATAARNEAISPWSEPDDPVPAAAAGYEDQGFEQRLGVLPSPTATAFSSAIGDSPVRGPRSRQGSAVSAFSRELGGEEGRGRKGSRVEGTIREEDVGGVTVSGEEVGEGSEGKRGGVSTYDELQRGWGTDSEDGAAESKREREFVRPKLGRMESDRAGLPSQLRGSVPVPQSPGSPREDDGEEEELYESTPRQRHFPGRDAGGGEELSRGEEERTPVVGRSGDWDKGPVIAEGKSEEDQGAQEEAALLGREDSAFDLAGLRDTRSENTADRGAETSLREERAQRQGAPPPAVSPERDDNSRALSAQTQDWDKRSAVSSEENFRDAKEGGSTELSYQTTSRRSSVSSIGNAGQTQEPMSAEAMPAGPVQMEQDGAQQQRFMNRPYRFGTERPMSYMPLGTTETGAPVQETLESGSGPESASVDLSGISGPPMGVQPYQKHPAMRDTEGGLAGDHGGLRSPPPAPDTDAVAATPPTARPSVTSRQVSAETRDRTSKRFSGLFRSRRPSQSGPTTVYGPAPSAISDQYGLENLPTGSAAVARPGTQASAEVQQAKRKSGIWENFKRSSMIIGDDSRPSSLAAAAPGTGSSAQIQQGTSPPPRMSTLKKPQRATTNATPPDPGKKKRFSGLGSLFGRSSTTAGTKSERPRKLMKQPNAPGSPATSGAATGYDAYEETRKRQAQQQGRPKSPEIGLPSRESEDIHTAAVNFPHGYAPPPGGWYGPGQDLQQEQQQQQPQYRILHSERERVDMPLDNVPEAFRPVDASYGRSAAPVGPPSQADERMPQRQLYSPPMSAVGGQRAFSAGQYPPYPQPAQRHASYGSNEYQLSPQVSGQSEYHYQNQTQGWQARGSGASVSPVHSRAGSETFARPQQVRVGSISEEIARGPPMQQQQVHGDQQQRPWAVSMAPPADLEGQGRRISNTPTWGYQDDYPPYEEYNYSSSSGPYPQMQVPKHRTFSPQQYPPQQVQTRYPSPPYSPDARPYPPHQYGPPQQHSHQRYFSHPGPARPYSGGPRPPTSSMMHQRSTSGSGYIGRRDEPALREEEGLEMRGTSYPGQEWAPGRWD